MFEQLLTLVRQTSMKMLAAPSVARLLAPDMGRHASVFMMHRPHDSAAGVNGHDPEFLRAAIHALRDAGVQFVRVADLVDAALDGRQFDHPTVAFTIDDGFEDQVRLADVFVQEACPVTVFVLTGFMDDDVWPWDYRLQHALRLRAESGQDSFDRARYEQLRDDLKQVPAASIEDRLQDLIGELANAAPPDRHRAMSWDTARELERRGVEFGPHGVTHALFSQMDDEQSRFEIRRSWQRLTEELASPVPILAWPTGRLGDFGPRDVHNAIDCGMVAALSAEPGYVDLDARDRYALRRFGLPHRTEDVLRYGTWIERGRQRITRKRG